ncbi:MAG: sel1 repeat family protein [Betaproteobacteria bacterium]|nr:sel1 repeat family protein [Betaproteobacteria bacterium]
MQLITLPAAITLTEWSERTFWRKFADGSLARETVNGKAMISFELIKPHLCLALSPDDLAILASAVAGDAEAQNEMALIFLANEKPKNAIYWLEQAAKQGCADAMNLLSQCYMKGSGVPQDENTGMIWLAKAATQGHLISQCQMQGLRNRNGPNRL